MRPLPQIFRLGCLSLLALGSLLGTSVLADYPESAYTDFSSKRYRSVQHQTSLTQSEILSRLNLGPEVRAVDASYTRLSDTGLKAVCQFKGIDYLGLQHTEITDAGLKHLSQLRELRYLNLSHSEISDSGVEHLGELDKLEVLMLSGTKVGDKGIPVLSKLRNIRYLMPSERITDRGLEFVGGLPELTHLHLHGSHLTDRGLRHLKDLEKLEVLTLPPFATEEGLVHIRGLKALQTLRLRMSSLSDEGLGALEDLVQMEVLNLNSIQFRSKRDPLYYLRKMSDLRLLYADGYELTDSGTEFLKLMPRIEILSIRSIALSDKGVANLKGLTKLRYLTFSENNSTDKGVIAALMKSHREAVISDPVEMSVFMAPLDQGFHNPNKIKYDKRYYEEYVKLARQAVHIDGVATFSIMTKDGLTEFYSGLDYTYLGRRFHAGQLIAFLQTKKEGGKNIYRGFLQDPLLKKQSFPNPYLRDVYHCVQILGNAKAKESVPILTELLSDKNHHIRAACIWSLAEIGEGAGSAVPELIHAMEDRRLSPAACGALAKIGKAAIPHLIKAVHSDNLEVRIYSVKALGELGPPAASGVPDLIQALYAERDTHGRKGYVSTYAAVALGEIGDSSALPDLYKNLEAKNHDVRSACQAAINKIEAKREQKSRARKQEHPKE